MKRRSRLSATPDPARARVLNRDLAALLREHPRLLRVLQEAGIQFCAGCWLTLSATPGRAAAYHGVPDIPRFLARVARAAGPRRLRARGR